MYLRNIFFILLAFVGPYVIQEVFADVTQSTKASSSHGSFIAETNDGDYKHHVHGRPQYPTQSPHYTSEYPPEYIPSYPPQYTPPYPTQGRPQKPPPFTVPTKPRPSTQPPYTQILYPSVKPTAPAEILDQFDHRYPDGSYEFRYELSDETVRYERGYFIKFHHKRSLVVRGYYSYRLPKGKGYLTVFYTADHFGYRPELSLTQHRPQLPRSLGERKLLEDEESTNIKSSINENYLQ